MFTCSATYVGTSVPSVLCRIIVLCVFYIQCVHCMFLIVPISFDITSNSFKILCLWKLASLWHAWLVSHIPLLSSSSLQPSVEMSRASLFQRSRRLKSTSVHAHSTSTQRWRRVGVTYIHTCIQSHILMLIASYMRLQYLVMCILTINYLNDFKYLAHS